MQVFKKGLVIALVLVIAFTVFSPALQPVAAAEYILDPASLNGQDYTDSEQLATLLDQVFAGDIDIYSDGRYTKEVSMPLGFYMSNSTIYYVKSQTTGNPVIGWQCYIYANAVYNKLFREWVGHANGFAHSRTVIPGGSNTISYELLKDSKVRCGAYLRTTPNSDGSYYGEDGHSMIILAYDRETITYLEGNGDGNGLVRVAIRDWDDFNRRQLSGRGRYISHMVQPTDAFYKAQFPACDHETYEGCGVCTDCGKVYDWEDTLDPWTQGIYRVTENVVPRVDSPYTGAAAAELTLRKNQTIKASGRYRNAFDQVWYSAQDETGKTFFVNGSHLEFVEYLPLEATCTAFSPENGAQLETKAYPVKGTVTSNYPLKSVSGYLDGKLYAIWTAGNETTTELDLRPTDLNHKLSFSKLESGKHTVTLMVQSFVHEQPVTAHESVFFTLGAEPCDHDHTGSVTRDATCTDEGLLTYTCNKCGDRYTRIITAYGHDYQNGVCARCGGTLRSALLSGSVRSGGTPEASVTVTLKGTGGEVYTAVADTGGYSIAEIQPGEYVLTAEKNGCVTLTEKLMLEQGENTFGVILCVPGDVTADTKLNIGDVSKLYAHIRGSNRLQDPYALLCADFTGDGSVNVGDVAKLYAFIRNRK